MLPSLAAAASSLGSAPPSCKASGCSALGDLKDAKLCLAFKLLPLPFRYKAEHDATANDENIDNVDLSNPSWAQRKDGLCDNLVYLQL